MQGVAIASDPGADGTYGLGDEIEVSVTFSEAVRVDTSGGVPRLMIDFSTEDWGHKWAGYESGDGASVLTFTHVVVSPNFSSQGVAVAADTLELNGGSITSVASGEAAVLSHTGLGHDSAHLVDHSQPGEEDEDSGAPSVQGVAIASDPGADGTYGLGDEIEVSVTFSEAVRVDTSGGVPRLMIDFSTEDWGHKWAGYESGDGASVLTFTHVVVSPNFSSQGVAVAADTLELNGGSITSVASGEAAVLSHTGLGHDSAHLVDHSQPGEEDEDSGAPSVQGVAIASDPGADGTYGLGDEIEVSVTFSEAVRVDTSGGVPRLMIDFSTEDWGHKWAGYESGDGASVLTFTHVVVSPNFSSQGVAVAADTLELNGGSITSVASGEAAVLSHTGLGHDSAHLVDHSQPGTECETISFLVDEPGPIADDSAGPLLEWSDPSAAGGSDDAAPDPATLPRGAPVTYYDGDEARTAYPVLASPGPGARGASGASGSAGLPAYVSESGNVMWLPGGVVLLLDPTWSAARADSFLAANGVARSRASELGWIDNGFLIEAGPGQASIELANSLATLDGVIISTPDWAVWPTPHQLDSHEPRAADSTGTGTDCPDPESDQGAAAADEVTAEQALRNRPTSIQVTARTQALDVTWVAATNPNVVAYDLQWIRTDAADKAAGNWTVVDDFWTSGDLTGRVTGLTDGVSYDVQMRAVSNTDHIWTATVTGEPRPFVPEVELIAGDAAITVALTQPEGERHLRVPFDVHWIRSDARDKTDGRWSRSDDTWGTARVLVDHAIVEVVDGLTNGVSYDVRARAITDVDGQWSATVRAVPYEPPHEIPDPDNLPSLNTTGVPTSGRFAGTDTGDIFKLVAEASTDVLILIAGSVATSCSLTDADGVEIDGGHRDLVLPVLDFSHSCAIRATLTADSYPATFYVKVVRADPEPSGERPFLLYANYEQPLGNSISAATPVDIGTFGGWRGGSHTSAGEADYLLIRTEREHWPFLAVVHPDHVPSVVFVDSKGNELRTGEPDGLHTTLLRTRFPGGDHYVKIEAPQTGFEGHYYLLWGDQIPRGRSENIRRCRNWTESKANAEPAIFTDELLGCQWYLENGGIFPLPGERITRGEDANVLDAHRNAPSSGPAVHLGEGVGVAVMDTGIDIDHQDLRDNTDPARSHSFCSQKPAPFHNSHGTLVAGLVAARDNDFGVRGVAPRATLHNHMAVDCLIGWSKLADAMTRNMADIGVHNNSWDFGQQQTLVGNPLIYDLALETGVNRGYGGKGVVYVRSSGNQHARGGDANLSEMRNHYTTMAVCAADGNGIRAWYSEAGANLWVCGPSQGHLLLGQGLTTTDLYDRYALHFNGTSASAPVVSGVAALVRAANPALTWRDVKLILAGSARRNHSNHSDWRRGAVKYGEDSERYWFNNTYGFGMVDADAAVRLAKSWTNLPTMLSRTASTDESKAIPDAPAEGNPTTWAVSTLTLDDGIEFIEHVEIEITLNARNFRQLQIELKPPGQPKRVILAQNDGATIPGKQWTKTYRLGASGFLGESAGGTWRLRIQDQVHGTVQRTRADGRDNNNALLEGWTIVVRGHGSSVQGFHDGNSTRLRIEENNNDGASVGAVPATDPDGDTLTYSLTSLSDPSDPSSGVGTDHNSFEIDGSGQITVVSGTTLDHEAKSSYHVIAQVSDSKDSDGNPESVPTADDSIAVTILVVDVNEPPGVPGIPTVSTAGPGRLKVTWPPSNTEGRPAVADYNLRYFKGTEAPENVYDWVHENEGAPDPGTNTSATITELRPGTSYVVQVNARSHEGFSGWSGLGVGTTEPGPALDSAIVAGASLVLAFDKALMTAKPPASAFTVKGAGGVASQIPTAVSVSGSYVILTLGTAAVPGNTVTMSYAVPDTNPIRDTDGNSAASFIDKAVPNDTLSGTALVSNLGKRRYRPVEWTGAAFRRAQAFTTGSYPLGYTMTRLELELTSYLRHDADYTVKIHNASDDGPGDKVVGTLTNPASLPPGGSYHHVEYTTSAGGIDLDGSTTYYVVWDMVAQDRTEGSLWTTPSHEEDPGGALGWSIGDEANVLKMRIHGSQRLRAADAVPAKMSAPSLSARTSTGFTVGWSAASVPEGASAVTGYRFERLQKPASGAPDWSMATGENATAAARSKAVSGLTVGKVYLVRVRASNGAGDGPWSDVVESAVVGAPDKMAAPTFTAESVSGFTVNWTAASVPSSAPAVSGYTIAHLEKPSSGDPDWSTATTATAGASATSKAVTGLDTNTEYLVRVRASNSSGDGQWSAAAEVSTADAVPAKMSAPSLSARTSTGFTVGWSAASVPEGASAVTGYRFERLQKPASGAPDWSMATGENATAAARSKAVSGLTVGKVYLVRVRASNGAGDGPWSDVVESAVVGAPDKMAAPTFTAESVSGFTVNWTAPSVPSSAPAVSGYTIAHLEKPSSGDPDWSTATTATAGASATSKAVTGLDTNTEYLVRVRASNSSGDGQWSAAAEVSTADAVPAKMSAPSLSARTSTGFTVGWSAASVPEGASAVTGYRFERLQKPASGAPDWSMATGENATAAARSKAVSGLTVGKVYLVRVRASNGAGDGPWSDVVESAVVGAPNKMAAPTFTAESVSGFTVNWTAASVPSSAPAVSGYTIAHLEKPSSGDPDWSTATTATAGASATSKAVTGLDTNTEYLVRVRASNNSGDGQWSAAAEVSTADAVPAKMSAPSLSARTSTGFTVGWSAASVPEGASAVTGYRFERLQKPASGAPDWSMATGENATAAARSKAVSGLTVGKVYLVRVRASNGAGDGPWSDVVESAVVGAPDKMAAPTFTAESVSGFTVNWTAPSVPSSAPAVSGYTIAHLEKPSSGDPDWSTATTATAGASATSKAVTGLDTNTEYLVRVRASNNSGDGQWSAAAEVSTADAVPAKMSAPSLSARTSTGFTVGWSAASVPEGASAVTGYRFERLQKPASGAPDWSMATGENATAAARSKAVSGLTVGKVYLVRVRASNGAGDGPWSDVVESAVVGAPNKMAAPTFTAESVSGFTVNWTAASVPSSAPAVSGYTIAHLEKPSSGDPDWSTATTATAGASATSKAVTGLDTNTEYLVRVRASNSSGDGQWSAAAEVSTADAVPAKMSAPSLSARTSTGFTVGWSAASVPEGASAVTGYRFERLQKPASGAPDWSMATGENATAAARSKAVSGLTVGKVYLVRVRASNGAGDGPWSDVVESAVVGAPNKMAAPTFTAESVSGFTVNWTAASVPSSAPAVSGYTIAHLEKPSSGDPDWSTATTATAGASATSKAVTGLDTNTEYLVRVRASNSSGDGQWSAAAEVSTADAVPAKMSAPSLSARTSTGFTVGWSAASVPEGASAVTGYRFERLQKPASGAPDWSMATGENATAAARSKAVSGLTVGKVYLVRVRASNGAGDGPWSDVVESAVVGAPNKMAAPTFTAESVSGFTVNWTAASVPSSAPAVSGYTIAHLEKPSSGDPDWSTATTATAGASATSKAVTGLDTNTEYLVRVRASNSSGDGQWSAAAEVSTADAVPAKMSAPSLSARTSTGFTVGWSAASVPEGASAVTGYRFERLQKPASGAPDWSMATGENATAAARSKAVSGLTVGKVYLVRVRASNGAGDGPWSDVVESAVVGAPNKMAAPTFTAESVSGFTVNWTAASVPSSAPAVSGYTIAHLEKPSSGDPDWSTATTATAGASATSKAVTGLDTNTEYLVRVRASNSSGDGQWSAAAEVSTADAVPAKMSAPSLSARTSTGFTVGWSAASVPEGASAVTGYRFERLQKPASGAPDWSMATGENATAAARSKAVSGLTVGKVYLVRVRASNGAGDGPWSDVVESAVVGAPNKMAAPTFTAESVSGFTVNWTAPSVPSSAPAVSGYTIAHLEKPSSGDPDWSTATTATAGASATSKAVTGLDTNTEYLVRVRASNNSGDGQWSAAAEVSTADALTVTISGGSAVTEGTPAAFTVTASTAAPSGGLTVNVSVSEASGSDFVASTDEGSKTVMIASGSTSASFSVTTQTDMVDELHGSVTVTVASGTGYSVGSPSSATVTVNDDDAPVLVSNIDQAPFSASNLASHDQAQGFTTGSNSLGYTLESIEVRFSGTLSGLSVKLMTGVSASSAGTEVAALTNPGTLTTGVNTFAAPTNPMLSASTTYFVVIEGNGGNVRISNSTGEDSGAADGWTISDGSFLRTRSSTGSWPTSSSSTRMIRVKGTTKTASPTITIAAGTSPVTEGTDASFTVTASPAPSADLTVNLTVSEASGSDFVAAGDEGSKTVTIASGETSATFSVDTVADAVDETDAAVTVTVASGTGYIVGSTKSASVTVNDNDAATGPTLTIAAGTSPVTEGTAASFTVTASAAPSANLTVNLSVSEASGSDFVASGDEGAKTVTINSGSTSATFSVSTQTDNTDEPDGSVKVTIASGNYKVGATDSASVAVNDDDDPPPTGPSITISGGSPVTEGTAASFTVTASAAPSSNLVVSLSVSEAAGSDLVASGDEGSKTVTIPANMTSATFSVATVADAVDEPDGSVTVTVASGTGYTVGSTSSATVTVNDNDAATGPTITISGGSAVTEGTAATFTVTASAAPSSNLVVNLSVSEKAGSDFVASGDEGSKTVTITGGSTTATYSVSTVADAVDEPDGSVTVTLASGTNYKVGATDSASVTVNDNDAASGPTITISGGSAVTEGTAATFTVTASAAPSSNLVVNLSVSEKAGSDFVASGDEGSKTVTITGGSTTASFSVSTVADSVDEPDGSVKVTLAGGTNYKVGSADSASVAVNDDDVTITISGGSAVTEGTAASFTVTASEAPSAALTVNLSVAETSGTNSDFVASGDEGSKTATIAANMTTATFTVATQGDNVDEPNGSVRVTVSSGTGYTVGSTSSASVAVNDDDVTITISGGSAVTEGTAASFTVTASEAPSAALTVNLSVAETSGTNSDFVASGDEGSKTATIAANMTTATFTVATQGDNVDEPNGSVRVTVSSGTGYTVGSASSASVTVNDDDAAPTGITLSLTDASDPNNIVDLASVAENGGAKTVTVTATVNGGTTFATDKTVVVSVAGSGTATAVDFAAVSSFNITISATAASKSATFTLTPTNDVVDETNETITVSGTLTDVTVTSDTFSLTDDDDPPTGITLSLTDASDPNNIVDLASVAENAGGTTVTVTATVTGGTTFATDKTVVVSVAGSGTETAVDFAAVSSFNITISAEATSKSATFTLTPTNDVVDETNETITVSGTLTDVTVTSDTFSLTDDDLAPTGITLSASPASVSEGATGDDRTVTVTATVTGGTTFATDKTVVVSVAGSGTATAVDFTAVPDFNITVAKETSSNTGTFTLAPIDDETDETHETITVSGVLAMVDITSGTLELRDNDGPSTQITLKVSPTSLDEKNDATSVTVTATLDASALATATTVSLELDETNSTAVKGSDYADPGTLSTISISADAKSGSATISIDPTQDNLDEGDGETVRIVGTHSGSLTVIHVDLTIDDDDDTPTDVDLSVDPSSVSETDTSATTVTVSARLRGEATRTSPTAVNLNSVLGGTATAGAGNDYTHSALSATSITIPTGAFASTMNVTFNVTPLQDATYEGKETIQVLGSTPVAGLTVNPATLNLADADVPRIDLSIDADLRSAGVQTSVREDDRPQWVRVTAAHAPGTAEEDKARAVVVTVTVGAAGSTATRGSGNDYTSASAVNVWIPANTASGSSFVTIAPIQDTVQEGVETIVFAGRVGDGSDFQVASTMMTLLDDETDSTALALLVSRDSIPERARSTPVRVTAELNGKTLEDDTTVTLALSGDATVGEGNDYTYTAPSTLVIEIGAGEASGEVTVNIDPEDDMIDELTGEAITISGTHAGVSPPLTVSPVDVTIADDDTASTIVALSASPSSIAEGRGSAAAVTVTAKLAGTVTRNEATIVTLDSTLGGTATSGSTGDYTHSGLPASITMAAGSLSASATGLSVTPRQDTANEGVETILVAGTLTGYKVHAATVWLVDDEVSAPGAPGEFTAELHGANAVRLTWEAPTAPDGKPVTSYRVERRKDRGDWETVSDTIVDTASNYADGNLDFNTVYWWRLSAQNEDGWGPATTEAEVTTGSRPPVFVGPPPEPDGPSEPRVPSRPMPPPEGFQLEDVPPTSAFAEEILATIELGIFDLEAIPDADPDMPAVRFDPQQQMSRVDIAAPLVRFWRVLGQPCPRVSAVRLRLADVTGTQAKLDVGCLLALGITNGTTRTTYSPENPLTRAQTASLLIRMWRASGRECPTDTQPAFTDVAADSVHRHNIACLRALGITRGTGATTFSPDRSITRQEAAALIARLHRIITEEQETAPEGDEPAP